MQLLSALTSTTSPLAMQAMPTLAPPTADFAALLAGMVPAEAVTAEAMPDVRQIAALPGNGLPVPVAAPDAVAAEVLTATPVLPVSATEAVLMLPAGLADPKVAVPVVAAAVGALAKLLPDADAPPPEPEKQAVPVLPTPPRFAAPLPRGRKLEEASREQPADTADDGDAEPVAADTVRVSEPELVVPADAALRAEIVLPPSPRIATPDADAKPPAQTILEDGSVIATDPATPMRSAKRSAARIADATVPTSALPVAPTAAPTSASVAAASAPATPATIANGTAPLPAEPVPTMRRPAAAVAPTSAPTEQVQPAIGRTTPLKADDIVPVHVVVPQQADTASVAVPQAEPSGAAPAPGQRSAIDAVLAPRDALPPVQQQPSTADIVDPVRSARAPSAPVRQPASIEDIVDAADATQTGSPAAARPAATPIWQQAMVPDGATASAATVPTAPAGQSVETPVTVAIEGNRPAAPLRSVEPIAMPAVAAPAPANGTAAPVTARFAPIAATTRTTPAASPRQPVAAPAQPDAAPVAAPNPVPTGNVAVAATPVASDATAAAPSLPQPPASATPLPGTTTQAPVDATPLRQPMAGEAAAPVVPVAAHTDPVARPAPVTRIAMPTPSAEPVAAPAIVDAAAPTPRARRDDDAPTLPTAAAALDPVVLRPVAAPVQAGQPTLDTRQPQWMEGMIDRIETLRESAGANGETRIRLSPDALGDVEIAIRTSDDGKVHVHFNSENVDAGRLLADAQPRLVQLAEARGLKLGGMQVDVGTQQQSQRQAPEQGNAPPRAPRSATTNAAPLSTNDNQRLA